MKRSVGFNAQEAQATAENSNPETKENSQTSEPGREIHYTIVFTSREQTAFAETEMKFKILLLFSGLAGQPERMIESPRV